MNAEATGKMRQPFLLFPFLLLRAATSVQVTGLGKITVEYGKDASCKCELHDQKGVQQVTWQRRLRDNRFENVASYSEYHGQHINEPYRGKVILSETSLTSASLTLKNATWADECCYICIFNVFPEPSKRKQTCLTVQGISEVNATVDQPDSGLTDGTTTAVFSCSATGKPPPFIRWDFSHNATILNKTVSTTVGNEDGTFTSTHNVTLLVVGSWDGHSDCVVQSSSQKKTVRVPFSWDPTSLEEEDTAGGAPPKTGVILTGMVVLAVIVAIGVTVLVVLGVCIRGKLKRFKFISVV
ncbi:OX-2 membrane glycoprotein-like isoform 2-T2 [Syngnathus typhle]